jgi:hypothetical protein
MTRRRLPLWAIAAATLAAQVLVVGAGFRWLG